MSDTHRIAAIVPARDLAASTDFYQRLGLTVTADHGDYRILSDGRGWHLHLRLVPGWPARIEHNALGLYLYVEDVDAVAERVRDRIIEPRDPSLKPWGCYEFSVSDPNGALIRIGRVET